MSDDGTTPSFAPAGPIVRGRVLWFDPGRGFGFVAPEGGGARLFLHISAVNRAGRHELPQDAGVVCRLAPGPRGLQIRDLLEVTDPPPKPPEAPVSLTTGTIAWYRADKGYGFLLADDGGGDVFVHKSVLARAGLAELDTGRRLRCGVREGTRGREAAWVAPL